MDIIICFIFSHTIVRYYILFTSNNQEQTENIVSLVIDIMYFKYDFVLKSYKYR